MSSIVQYQNDIAKYNNLKTTLNYITTRLSSAIQDASDLNTEIKTKYLINDKPAPISSDITALINEMKDTVDYLNKTVNPAIVSAIGDCQREKELLEQKEKENGENLKRTEENR